MGTRVAGLLGSLFLLGLGGCVDRVILDDAGFSGGTEGSSGFATDTMGSEGSGSGGGASTGDDLCVPGVDGCPCPQGQLSNGEGCVTGGVDELEAVAPVVQSALAGDLIPEAPSVRVLSAGTPVPNVPVTFSVAGLPGGLVEVGEAITDATGVATAERWTLGKLDGDYFVRARVPSSPEVEAIDFTGRTLSDFEIQLVYIQPPTPSQEAAFETARRRWQGVLVNALEPIAGDLATFGADCGVFGSEGAVSITGVVIFVQLEVIDGPGGDDGNILGQAGPCALREDGSPFLGVMTFDTFDLDGLEAEGSLETVILHEMGHVLGVGSLWRERGLLINPSVPDNAGADTHFIGPAATQTFTELLGGAAFEGSIVPVENNAQPGSSDGHWRESVVVDELMSPRLGGFGEVAPLSTLTISGLGDHGYYKTNLLAADAWTLPPQGLESPSRSHAGHVGSDLVLAPRWKLDGDRWVSLP